MNRLALPVVFLLSLSLSGCAHRVVRDASSYTAEIVSSLSRQEAAEKALLEAAGAAREAGDFELCVSYATPAFRIQARAEAEAYRALWLADLPYPVNGELPDPKASQEDPGEAPAFDPGAVESFCEVD